jgi:peptide/nickel transport system permease protein/dipeptide transport system permease protein
VKIGLVLVGFFVLVAGLSPWLAPARPDEIFSEAIKLPPMWKEGGSPQFPLGTDDIGRDVLSRLIGGAPVSLGIGFFVVLLSTTIGTALGLIAGSLGGWVDQTLSRLMDILMALPSMLMAIVVVSILGPSLMNTVIAVGIVSIPAVYRLVRGAVLSEMTKTYVVAARSYGAGWTRIAVVNVLPNCLAPLIVQASLGFSEGILNAAALGFLGLGAQAPTPEWGTMLADARSSIESSPWLVTLPGLCILLAVVGFNLIGDGLRDHLDPKLRR